MKKQTNEEIKEVGNKWCAKFTLNKNHKPG